MKPETPIVVFVPSIGRIDFLPETRRCIEGQTLTDFKVVILDNASGPEATAFFTRWAKEDPRVAIARVDSRVPMFENFNRGLRSVQSGFVTFFHDDDVYEPRYLEVLAQQLDRFPTAAFAGSNYDFINSTGALTEKRRWILKTELWDAPRYASELIGRNRNPVPMPGLVFRRSAFAAGGFDESLPIHFGDFILLLRAAENGGLVVVDEPLIKIRRHENQASVSMPLSEGIALRTKVLREYLSEFVERHPEHRGLATRLRRRTEVLHRVGELWGWLNAETEAERAACLASLGDTLADALIQQSCSWATRRGLRTDRLSRRMVGFAKRVAETIKA